MRNDVNTDYSLWLWVILWLIITISAVMTLPGFGGHDSYRYVAIAQSMLHNHHYWIPFWEGHPYSDKPPLLFWLFILGWKIFGIHLWWPQLVVMLFGLASIYVTYLMAQQLWSDDKIAIELTPFILIGSFFWVWSVKQVAVDALLLFFVILALYSLLIAAKNATWGWWLYTISIIGGGLTKGPVLFVFILIPALLLPRWVPIKTKSWYPRLIGTTLLGCFFVLLWAVPAALLGGTKYTQEIFYDQIWHRTHHLSGNNTLFYLYRLPFWLLPWTLYWPFWRGLIHSKNIWRFSGIKICLSVIVVSLIVFTVFSQKEPQYVYPQLPFYALFIGLCISHDVKRGKPYHVQYQWPFALLFLCLGLSIISFHAFFHLYNFKLQIRLYFINSFSANWSILFIVIGFLLFINGKCIYNQVILLCITLLALHWFVNTILIPTYMQYYLAPDKMLFQLQRIKNNQEPVAIIGDIFDEKIGTIIKNNNYPFIEKQQWKAWALQHTHGWLLTNDTCIPVSLFPRIIPRVWYYQSRFYIVSLWKISQLQKVKNLCK